ncbi:MAG: outer membrane biogenesis protein BamB [Candidatus Hydrogenedentes bacterium ADurb.Bin101]|nr:MAG: outer membrane biogenesis protein BamB [Candidatus Hydrogenedentes bacterium ADurb.Bin101]
MKINVSLISFPAGKIILSTVLFLGVPSFGEDQPQWGERHSRNMVSQETGLPIRFNLETGEGILWSVALGGGSYGSPIVAQGRVFIGTNNSEPLDERHHGDRGVLLCLDARDGSLVWQLVVPRIGGDDFLDWPGVGICSEPTVEGDRIYTVTTRSEVVCLDLHGLENGNDGPYLDEGRHSVPMDSPAIATVPPDADILWRFDLRSEIGQYPHDSPHMSILLDGECLYLNTGNGVDNTHKKIGNPEAPSCIALDKKTGRLLAEENEGIGPRTFHESWSSPSLGEVNGRRLLFFGGPDGICYAFKTLVTPFSEQVISFDCVWRFDCDPEAPKENIHDYVGNTRESPSEIMGMPVFYKNRVYVVAGGDIWWGKRRSWLKCIDATLKGDITRTGELWSYDIPRQSCATPAILNGLVFVTDDAGCVHCVDAETGEAYWVHKVGRSIWSSALGADHCIYVGARNGDFAILAATKQKQVLFSTRFPDAIHGTPTAANGVLYVSTLSRLYAIKTP